MATQIQKMVLQWMAQAGGEMLICTGFKKTREATLKASDTPCIATSVNVVGGLTNPGNRYIEKKDQNEFGRAVTYRLTDAGREVLARMR